jgi:hypothetical protein
MAEPSALSSERDISAADFATIYSVEHGRNDTQESAANTEYFRRTDERVPKVKASPVRQCPRNHVVRRYDKAGRGLYSRGSGPSFRPDLQALAAAVRSGGQGGPLFAATA